jgi:enoyl-CoA hydratase/carnithine racemase
MLQGGPELSAWLASRPRRPVRPSAGTPAVLVRRSGAGLEITLNRPDRHNAFSAAMRDGVIEALAIAVVEPAIRTIVLRGDGPSFCSGGDLDEFGTFPDPATAHAVRMTRSPARLLAGLAGRVRAEVHGACIGAGIELAAFAGRVVATADAFFQLPEVGMGLVPGAGGTVSLPRRIGRQRTAELALSGRRLDAGTALAWGLIDEIVPA